MQQHPPTKSGTVPCRDFRLDPANIGWFRGLAPAWVGTTASAGTGFTAPYDVWVEQRHLDTVSDQEVPYRRVMIK